MGFFGPSKRATHWVNVGADQGDVALFENDRNDENASGSGAGKNVEENVWTKGYLGGVYFMYIYPIHEDAHIL